GIVTGLHYQEFKRNKNSPGDTKCGHFIKSCSSAQPCCGEQPMRALRCRTRPRSCRGVSRSRQRMPRHQVLPSSLSVPSQAHRAQTSKSINDKEFIISIIKRVSTAIFIATVAFTVVGCTSTPSHESTCEYVDDAAITT